MRFINKSDHYITVVFVTTIIVIVATSFFTFKEIFARSTQQQQEAIMPLFSLITSEIIRPITISEYMASDPFLLKYIQQDEIENKVLLDYLTSVSSKANALSFIAIEKHQYLIDSNKKIVSLNNKKVEWYHRLKALDKNKYIDFGNAENPHLYFDIKMFSEQQTFIGFVGLAIDLDHFSTEFRKFKDRFGFELYFVDENDFVTLSSTALMETTFNHRRENLTNINDLEWFQSYQELKQKSTKNNVNDDEKNNSSVFSFSNNDLIVSQMPLKELGWRVFIVAPPVTQQGAYWQLFLQKVFILLVVSFTLYYILSLRISKFRTALSKGSEIDFLTQLPNRAFIHAKYAKLSKAHHNASVVIADIDNFKVLNDSYGHVFGDEVLKVVAHKLGENLRNIDLVGRWGGEEFIFIFPDTSAHLAQEIVDRIRKKIANTSFTPSSTSAKVNVTVSFGVSSSNITGVTLEEIILNADKALYNAKANGRNKVVVHLG